MNIFVLDTNIKLCAQYHCDKHVVKMMLEYAQLLSSVHRSAGRQVGYELTHKNHPCAVWARTSQENYDWLMELALEVSDEYTYRYGKQHKSLSVIESLPCPNLPSTGLTVWPKCVTDDLKSIPDVVDAYRMYYCRDKAYFCKWKNREIPEWFSPQAASS